MVEAVQVQDPVHDHVRPVRGARLALLLRFAANHGRADHEIAELAFELALTGEAGNDSTLVGLSLPR